MIPVPYIRLRTCANVVVVVLLSFLISHLALESSDQKLEQCVQGAQDKGEVVTTVIIPVWDESLWRQDTVDELGQLASRQVGKRLSEFISSKALEMTLLDNPVQLKLLLEGKISVPKGTFLYYLFEHFDTTVRAKIMSNLFTPNETLLNYTHYEDTFQILQLRVRSFRDAYRTLLSNISFATPSSDGVTWSIDQLALESALSSSALSTMLPPTALSFLLRYRIYMYSPLLEHFGLEILPLRYKLSGWFNGSTTPPYNAVPLGSSNVVSDESSINQRAPHIGILGGSFSPITVAHIRLAKEVLASMYTTSSELLQYKREYDTLYNREYVQELVSSEQDESSIPKVQGNDSFYPDGTRRMHLTPQDILGKVSGDISLCPVQEVWLVPCSWRPDKPSLNVSPLTRHIMTVLAIEEECSWKENIFLVPLELNEPIALTSYELLSRLQSISRLDRQLTSIQAENTQRWTNAGHRGPRWNGKIIFSLIVGEDLLPGFVFWANKHKLMEFGSLLVSSRELIFSPSVNRYSYSSIDGHKAIMTAHLAQCLAEMQPLVPKRIAIVNGVSNTFPLSMVLSSSIVREKLTSTWRAIEDMSRSSSLNSTSKSESDRQQRVTSRECNLVQQHALICYNLSGLVPQNVLRYVAMAGLYKS